jgi:uncharacterized protein (TIGR00730 family)
MTFPRQKRGPFPSAHQDAQSAERRHTLSPQVASPSYRLAFQDPDFLLREELRPVRLQLELLKPELTFQEQGIESTVVIFGSARTPDPEASRKLLDDAQSLSAKDPENPAVKKQLAKARKALELSRYYDEARKLGRLISTNSPPNEYVVITGGGAGIMGAANRGAHDVGAKNIGLNIVLPFEQEPNLFITPELSFQFHYFAVRKMHFLIRAKALVTFPGGFGTLDELFETLTLVQTRKVDPIPILLFGKEFWSRVIDFEFLVDQGTISPADMDYIQYVETAEEAWEIISKSNGISSPPPPRPAE